MKQKLLACDVDGTLIHHYDQKIQESDLKAIKKFTDAGHLFALCTGRTLTWTTPILDAFDLPASALILCNGSMIYEVKDKVITGISSKGIPCNIGKEIITHFYNKKEFSLYWDNGQNTFEMEDRLLIEASSIIQESYSKHVSIDTVASISTDFVTIGVTPMSGSVEIAEEIKKEIESRWGDYVDTFRNQYFIDIAPPESSKGTGITLLTNYLNKDLDVYGIGDSFNDLPMFQTVGKENAFLMTHGEQELKPYADNHVRTVAECIDILLSK